MERIDDLQYKGLKIIQNTEGFCFGVDSVLLTEFAKDIKKGSKIVDLGTGTGILGILLCKKVEPKTVIGIEKQKEVADMAKRSISLNGLDSIFKIVNSDINDIELTPNYYDVIITNPPYKKAGSGIDSKREMQHISRYETTANLDEWIKTSSKLLNSKGSFYMVYRTDRLAELFEKMRKYKLEPKKIRLVYSKVTEQSNLILVKAIKDGNTFLTVEKPLIIYNEDGTYSNEIKEIYKKNNK